MFLRRPVTLLLVAANVALFAVPGGVPLRDVCLSPYAVVELNQWARWEGTVDGTGQFPVKQRAAATIRACAACCLFDCRVCCLAPKLATDFGTAPSIS